MTCSYFTGSSEKISPDEYMNEVTLNSAEKRKRTTE
jgi:hypothetical protein